MATIQDLQGIYGGQSPLTQAAIASYNQSTLPIIQNQMALQGLGQSPALGMALGSSLAQALPQFIMGGEQLNQSGAQTMANIANMQQQGQLSANQQALQSLQGLSQNAGQAAGAQNQQLNTSLGAFGGAGKIQQDILQNQIDTAQMDFLRRQGLAEQATTGLFGGTTLPPTLQQSGTSNTSTSGK
jgi:hypothetical protein